MPDVVRAVTLITFIIGVLPGIIRTILTLLGISFVTYTGVTAAFDSLINFVASSFAGLPATAVQIVAITRIDVAISMILSAYVAAATLSGLTRWRRNRPGVASA